LPDIYAHASRNIPACPDFLSEVLLFAPKYLLKYLSLEWKCLKKAVFFEKHSKIASSKIEKAHEQYVHRLFKKS
jgi:hypothetical protein